jgi:D-alanyl-D-alanine carboxypeptidase
MVSFALSLMTLPFSQSEAHYASIVMDTQSGSVLHEANADTPKYPASLVKMMTLYLTFEALTGNRIRLEQGLEISKYAAGMAPSKLGLRVGQQLRAEEAILAIVTKSANDAAVVLAEALGGSELKFAQMMNDKAHELGLTRTTFRNASGLPNRSQVSTARDMATLAGALLRDFPQYYPYFSVTEFRYRDRTYYNHNRLIEKYLGADGIKTGYTRAAGFNLAACVKRGEHRLIAVVLGGETAKSRDQHTIALLNHAFARIGVDVASLVTASNVGAPGERRPKRRTQENRRRLDSIGPAR